MMTQEFKTIGQVIDHLNTEEGKNDKFKIGGYLLEKSFCKEVCSVKIKLIPDNMGLAYFISQYHDCEIQHIPYEPPKEITNENRKKC